jgi:hypothetical protein
MARPQLMVSLSHVGSGAFCVRSSPLTIFIPLTEPGGRNHQAAERRMLKAPLR